MAYARLVASALFAAVSMRGSQASNVLRQNGNGASDVVGSSSFVRPLEYQHSLRVCNAYPFAAALDVHRGASESLTGRSPMAYKECRDFEASLKAGDKLDFKIGYATAGTFSVTDMPNNDAVLLLVIHRHDTLSTAVAFESHVFASVKNAQVAIIDAYKGAARSTPRIQDEESAVKRNISRSEELRFNSVVAVSPGIYDISLAGSDGETKARRRLVALGHQSYTILRTGVESVQGQSFPQELVVFPRSDEAMLRSGAASFGPLGLLLMA
eukprot:CAMPEP_0197909770 /NCGR_PEP_ID=MMETSP1439-20131203/69551_1 /TAXON_ID=66791 /ORGANISM="Gonyaulax spinifera, Strain CCMP409" /LENGTH=268 /DNA_ID=CAMNT_0043531373 /DNA_START=62 /DNA_END=865 /DNA_ORIENTATION=+